MKTNHFLIEPLEARIAPATVATFHSPITATYDDVDGDHVTVKFSLPVLTAGNVAAVFNFMSPGYLADLDLTASASPDGTAITFTVAKVAGGDGLVNVGYIHATGHDLGKVAVPGDLGQIDAGSGSATVPAIKSLSVRSLGRLGLDTQAAGGSLDSDIKGALGSLKVAGDVVGAYLIVFGATTATLGPVTIGGSLIGGSGSISGEIGSTLEMGAVKIGHDVLGGSGFISGLINTSDKLAGVSIGGSLIGGSNGFTGEIRCAGLGAVKIGHNLTGGSITGAASLDRSGVIESGGRISSMTIGGSIVSGIDTSSGALTFNATIRAGNDIGALAVKGSLVGHGDTGSGASPVIISARGQAFPSPGIDLAIGHITVGGRVEFANILAGYDIALNALNGDAQIGAVSVGGDWIASNLVAGAMNLGADNVTGGTGANADNVNFGDSHDFSSGSGSAGIIAKIASITIAGQVFGTPNSTSSTDHFGFVAEQIGAVKIGGNAIALTAGPDNLAVGETSDMTVHEV